MIKKKVKKGFDTVLELRGKTCDKERVGEERRSGADAFRPTAGVRFLVLAAQRSRCDVPRFALRFSIDVPENEDFSSLIFTATISTGLLFLRGEKSWRRPGF